MSFKPASRLSTGDVSQGSPSTVALTSNFVGSTFFPSDTWETTEYKGLGVQCRRNVCSVFNASFDSKQPSMSLGLSGTIEHFTGSRSVKNKDYLIGIDPVVQLAVDPQAEGFAYRKTGFSWEELQNVFHPKQRVPHTATEAARLAEVEAMARKYKSIMEDPRNPCPKIRAAVLQAIENPRPYCYSEEARLAYEEFQAEWDAYTPPAA
jgi:hypothetical protein